MKKLHICRNDCDPSHKVWNDNNPNDPILVGECIHHEDEDHDNNEPSNLYKMMLGKHASMHNTGKVVSEETKKLMRLNRADTSGKNHPMFGRKHSEEAKRKMSKAKTGKVASEEARRNMSKGQLDRKYSEEAIRKMSEARLGKKNPFYGKTHTKDTLDRIRKTKLANMMDADFSDVGMRFKFNNKSYKVEEYKPRSKSNPLVCRSIDAGERFSLSMTQNLLNQIRNGEVTSIY